jgi:hypothetical protein
VSSWGKILNEVKESAKARGGQPDLDGLRLRYIERIRELTGHAVIVYASGFPEHGQRESAGGSAQR